MKLLAEWESEVIGKSVRCGTNSWKEEESKLKCDVKKGLYLIAEISIGERVVLQMEDEKVINVEISLLVHRSVDFDEEGNPVYRTSRIDRVMNFADESDVYVPIIAGIATEQDSLGIREVLMKISVKTFEEESEAAYGTLTVVSGEEGSEILLDGGVVGKFSAGKEYVLKNVPVGLRIVGMRDSSGRELKKSVRVKAKRTVLVDLSSKHQDELQNRFRLLPLGKNVYGYDEYQREADGAVVVKIPAGEFLMGNKETERSPLEHQVYVSEFLMDKTGVTWGQYKKYVEATRIPLPPHDPYWGIHDNHPAVYVTWEEAKAYCEWAGARLPTEAEREKAARGTDGRKYPWGNEEPTPELGVYRRHWGREATAAVGTHPAGASPYGLLDMGGNVWEWCADWYNNDYYLTSPYKDPKGPSSGTTHVVRGGSWDSRPTVLSASCRSWGHWGYREGDFGFRCAMNIP